MAKRFFKTLLVIFLTILPFSTVLSNFSPYWTTHTFNDFVAASFVFALVCLVLGWLVSHPEANKSGTFLFLLGIAVGPPLMLGPPEESAKLLERATEEHFRYGMLILATILFTTGFIAVLKGLWNKISGIHRLIILPFFIAVAVMFWDNISSYLLSQAMQKWVDSGNNAADFMLQYDYQSLLRTSGRTLVYVSTIWLCVILLKAGHMKKWIAVVLSVFCCIGIIFFFLFNFISPAYYFPFMVPAIVLAPVYWLGIALISTPREIHT